jgi:hypothetical protein
VVTDFALISVIDYSAKSKRDRKRFEIVLQSMEWMQNVDVGSSGGLHRGWASCIRLHYVSARLANHQTPQV